MTTHPTPEAIADAQAATADHVAACPDCQRTARGLELVARGLARLAADPPPMPADVSSRLQEVVREAALRPAAAGQPAAADSPAAPGGRAERPAAGADPAGSGGGTAGQAARPVTLLPSRSGQPRRRRLLLAAAAALVLVAAAGAALAVTGSNGPSRSASSAAAGGSAAGGSAAGAAGTAVVSSGHDYSGERSDYLAVVPSLVQAPRLSAKEGTAASRAAGPAGSQPSADALRTAPPPGLEQVVRCTGAVTADPAAHALVVDSARYRGQPALVVVVPAPGKPALLDVYVTGSGCGTSPGRDDLLAYAQVPRG